MNQRLIQTFFDLVQIDSPTNHEEKFGNFLMGELGQLGLFVTKDQRGNIYARREGEGEAIFFSAHMDTVEPGRGIKPRVEDGYLVSDGTTILGADDKSGVAVILETLKSLEGKKTRPLEFVFTVSEEAGNFGAIDFDYKLLQAKRGYCFDLSQPVGTITTASPYYERFDMKLIGRAAHASHPEEGKNVLPALGEILTIAPLGQPDSETYFNIGVVTGGQVRNTILGEVFLKGEIRSFVEKNLHDIKSIFQKAVDVIVQKYGVELEQEWVRENGGYKHESQEAAAFIEFTKKIMLAIDVPFRLTQTSGVSDANIFNDHGVLCFNLGDGSEFSHTTHERVKVSELENLVQFMLTVATRS